MTNTLFESLRLALAEERGLLLESLRLRIRGGIDWGRTGPWPPDAVTALDELFDLLAERERPKKTDSPERWSDPAYLGDGPWGP